MRTILLAAALALAIAFASVPAASHVTPGHGGATCGGTAPATTTCSTGDHLMTWSSHLELDFSGTGNYTGTLEATLTQGHNVYTLRCGFTAGVSASCASAGTLPTQGFTFRHDCRSLDAGTTTPGGSGPWQCRIYHVVV